MKAATTDGARVIFQDGRNELITKDRTVFCIEEHNRPYYVRKANIQQQTADETVNDRIFRDKVSLTCDV